MGWLSQLLYGGKESWIFIFIFNDSDNDNEDEIKCQNEAPPEGRWTTMFKLQIVTFIAIEFQLHPLPILKT